HHVLREFTKLSNESQILRAGRNNLGAIAFRPAQKLAGDKGHHAGNADTGFKNPSGMVLKSQVPYDLRHDLAASACCHGLPYEVSGHIDKEAIAPKDVDVRWLPDEMRLVSQYDGSQPTRLGKGDEPAFSRDIAGAIPDEVKEGG